ncbi:phage tail domain-containing protein [Cytobacillus firmus]|uniref:phage tail domain-containing protein n=1 Tax=Cytobacillus firmus TaxID=1399 RepID=UPI0018CF7987|nr:phage tail domain-containing protein [Cytobacillus firmus]MBG9657097.1 hypothetical protein [Cytobacillus firmus]MED1906772.1 phage tail family protein [Cytobacillus firmus]
MKITLYNGIERVVLTSHPFKLAKKIDLSGLGATINTVDTNQDGANFLNSVFNTRDVDFEGYIRVTGMKEASIQKHRDTLYRVFNPKNKVTVEFEDENIYYMIEGYPVSFPVFQQGFENSNYTFQRFLLQMTCTDPFIYKNKKTITFADVVPKFSFPLEFNAVNFGEKSNTLMETVHNSGVMECPIEITMKATNPVENPYLINVYTQKQIRFKTILQDGELLFINTGRKKEVYKLADDIKTVYFHSLDLNSDLALELAPGDNIFRFGADSGEQFLQIEVSYREKLGGV